MSLMEVAGSRHCSQRGCGQLDFLPFNCLKCQRVFCLAHHKLQDHDCTFDPSVQNVMPQCPVCNQVVYVPAGASADAIVNAHLLSRCTAHLLSSQRETQKGALSAATRCDQPTGCRNAEKFATVICKLCGGQFCLSHRLESTHRCVAGTAATAAAASSAAAEKNAKGKALLEKIKAKREAAAETKAAEAQAKAAALARHNQAQAEHDRAHAAAFPTKPKPASVTPAPAATSASSSSAAAAVPAASASSSAAGPRNGGKPYTTLQQIRAGINAAGSATMSAISSVLPSSLSSPNPSPSPSPSPSPPAAAHSSAAAAASSAASPAASAPSMRTVPLTLAMKRAALGDADLAEESRRYLFVDVSLIRPKRAVPTLCFFNGSRHSVGKVLDLICENASIENENHLPQGKRLYVSCPRMGVTFPAEFQLAALKGVLLDGDTITVTRQPLAASA